MRTEQWEEGYAVGFEAGVDKGQDDGAAVAESLMDIRAAVQFLHTQEKVSDRYTRCVHCQYPWPCDTVALLAGNSAGALAEAKADTWDECCEALAWAMHRGDDPIGYVHKHNPYRDAEGEDPRLHDSANDGALDARMHEDGGA